MSFRWGRDSAASLRNEMFFHTGDVRLSSPDPPSLTSNKSTPAQVLLLNPHCLSHTHITSVNGLPPREPSGPVTYIIQSQTQLLYTTVNEIIFGFWADFGTGLFRSSLIGLGFVFWYWDSMLFLCWGRFSTGLFWIGHQTEKDAKSQGKMMKPGAMIQHLDKRTHFGVLRKRMN